VYTRWIETEFDNDIEPWSGELEAAPEPEKRHSVVVEVDGKRLEVSLPAQLLPTNGSEPARAAAPSRRGAASVSTVTGAAVVAPMQATVVKLAVGEGDKVVKGDLVAVLEAMKMEQPLTAHRDGTVTRVGASVGETVSSGTVLLEIVDA
jgi:acetyl-CoA/propionyl-CoA carboxylase biotin carboxyl carrier protein